ncbi:DNA recombination and repair protein [Klebsormidium nitens]|uniref:DNA recombination and repair protein n=1 Tax=Klebsormidium nitens TaxID=105231 RepID=A0A1Y1IMM9_KLENI|nr:DNA recombination and repair protein [Klebsormidium nitens]|eukprot:GAQ89378.1 DNA recombination and repair protein [Klebsormidium nitens]
MDGSSEYPEEALLRFLQPDESMRDFLLRTFVEPLGTSVPFIDSAAIRPGNVVEIFGASGSGKTEILTQAVATCILPSEVDGVGYGGAGGAALFFDLDGRFDILRLVRILESRINEAQVAQGGGDADALSQVFTASLRRFRLLHCHNSFHLLAALKMLQPEIRQIVQNHGPDSLHLICIDSIGAFHWLDKGLHLWAGHRDALTQSGLSKAVVTELKHIMKRHRPLMLATKSAIGAPNRWRPYGSGSTTASGRSPQEGARGSHEDEDPELPQKAVLYHKEYMPAVWQDFVTHRLVLQGPASPDPGGPHQQALLGPPVFSAQWEKPPGSDIAKFVILDVNPRSLRAASEARLPVATTSPTLELQSADQVSSC